MQSLVKCPKRQYAVPRRLFSLSIKNTSKRSTIFNTGPSINFSYTTDRLRIPVSYHAYKVIRKEINALHSVLLKHAIGKPYCLSHFCGARNFSTSSYNRSEDDSSKNSGKKSNGDQKKKNEELEQLMQKLLILTAVFIAIFVTMHQISRDTEGEFAPVSWNEFAYHMLAKGEVAEVKVKPGLQRVVIILHDGAVVKGRKSQFGARFMDLPNVEHFEERVRKVEESLGIKSGDRIPITYERTDEYIMQFFRIAFMTLLGYTLYKVARSANLSRSNMLTPLTKPNYTLVDPKSGRGVRFNDIAGLKEAKVEIMEFVDFFKNPDRYKALGAKIPKGVLLLGPPGCGKTLLAKAVATEANVTFFSMNGSEFIQMIGGLGALRVRNLFKAGKKWAPSIIYIDEIDAIGKKRSDTLGGGTTEKDHTLNQLLVEMDGILTNENTIVLASTNRADILDNALLRPGRFDRHILIDLPTTEERKQIFELYLKKLSLEGKPEEYSEYLSYLTNGLTGADIANLCNEAALHAARDKKKKVDNSDLMYAFDRIVSGLVKKNATLTPHERKRVAYHEAGHALVGWLSKHTVTLLKITIRPRTDSTLGFAQYIPSTKSIIAKEELFDRMCMLLGGRVAEHIIFNDITDGAQSDLKKVTELAYAQVQEYGMSPNIGLLSFPEEATSVHTRKLYSKSLGNLMDAEARKIIASAYKTTEKLLKDNQDKLHLLVEELLKKETLTYDDVEKLIGPPPFQTERYFPSIELNKSTTNNESKTPEPVPT